MEIVCADHQNKADVGSQIAQQWYDAEPVDLIIDVPNPGVALAIHRTHRHRLRAHLPARHRG